MKLILASNSPRRNELLRNAGFKFEIISSDYEETGFSNDPILTAETFAVGKAQAVFNSVKEGVAVIGADTVVFEGGDILGKPKSEEEGALMLKRLSGKTHSVVTGYAVITSDEIVSGSVMTEVTFNNLSDELISEYIKSGLYKGKAGSYGIQDPFPLVKSYNGSLTNVLGLPIETIIPILEKIVK